MCHVWSLHSLLQYLLSWVFYPESTNAAIEYKVSLFTTAFIDLGYNGNPEMPRPNIIPTYVSHKRFLKNWWFYVMDKKPLSCGKIPVKKIAKFPSSLKKIYLGYTIRFQKLTHCYLVITYRLPNRIFCCFDKKTQGKGTIYIEVVMVIKRQFIYFILA